VGGEITGEGLREGADRVRGVALLRRPGGRNVSAIGPKNTGEDLDGMYILVCMNDVSPKKLEKATEMARGKKRKRESK